MSHRRTLASTTALVTLAATLAGCFVVRESAEPIGSDVNNDPAPSADYNVSEVPPGGCIASTTGEPQGGSGVNTCPQGQVEKSG